MTGNNWGEGEGRKWRLDTAWTREAVARLGAGRVAVQPDVLSPGLFLPAGEGEARAQKQLALDCRATNQLAQACIFPPPKTPSALGGDIGEGAKNRWPILYTPAGGGERRTIKKKVVGLALSLTHSHMPASHTTRRRLFFVVTLSPCRLASI